MIIEISVAVIAIAFLALVIYLIVMTKALRVTLAQVNHTLVDVRKQLDGIGGQTQKVVEHANQISVDLKHKADALNPIFNAIANIGEILEHKSFTLKKETIALHEENYDSDSDEKKKQPDEWIKTTNILELVGLGLRLWQKINKRR